VGIGAFYIFCWLESQRLLENRNMPVIRSLCPPLFRHFQFVFPGGLDYSKKEPARREEPLFKLRGS
jgi:hypothetical protein